VTPVVKDFAVVVEEADEFHEGSKRAQKERLEKGNRRSEAPWKSRPSGPRKNAKDKGALAGR
jgi:hypothetical protein